MGSARDGHTILVISHDLSLAPEADRIMVMDGGVYAAMHAAAGTTRGAEL